MNAPVSVLSNKYDLCFNFDLIFPIGAEPLAEKILDVTKDLLPEQKLVLQCYDGASVMSGRISGVQARVREKIDTALFIHCMAHEVSH